MQPSKQSLGVVDDQEEALAYISKLIEKKQKKKKTPRKMRKNDNWN